MTLIHRKPQPREKEKALHLKDAQMADLKIGVLLGLGLRNSAAIGAKVGYSEKGVKNRRNGVNALFISEIEKLVKHEIEVNRKVAEHVAAEDLKAELGKRAGRIVANLDDALESGDVDRKDRATFKVANHLLPKAPTGRPRKGDEQGMAPAVYNVRVGAINVIRQHVNGEPITLPDQAKTIDVVPISLPLPQGANR